MFEHIREVAGIVSNFLFYVAGVSMIGFGSIVAGYIVCVIFTDDFLTSRTTVKGWIEEILITIACLSFFLAIIVAGVFLVGYADYSLGGILINIK